jgi:hypothetical protein
VSEVHPLTFRKLDGYGDPTTPPMFSCEKCGGEMYPEYYKRVQGIEYKISDIR